MNSSVDDEITVIDSDETQPLLSSSAVERSPGHSVNAKLRDVIDRSVHDSDSTSIRSASNDRQPYTSCPAAVFLTVNAALGAGLLNFPYAFNSAGGLVISFSIQAVLLVLIVGALFILTHCASVSKTTSFQDVVEAFCGTFCKNLVAVAIIIYSYGACLTFIIIIGDQFDRVFASSYGSDFCHVWYLNRKFTMTVSSVLFILPLCFSKTIDFLKYSSSCGVLVVGYLIFLSFYEWLHLEHTDVHVRTRPEKWTDITKVLPAICFGYQCHLSWVPTYAGMKESSSSPRLFATVLISMIICCSAYTAVTIFGVLTFGSNVNADLMKNYDASEALVLIGIAAIGFKTITTYPLLLFCARVAIDDYYVNLRGIISSDREGTRRVVIVLIWFLSSVCIAITVPDITVAIDVLGTLAVAFIFILPGLCLINATLAKDPYLTAFKNQLLCLLGSIYIASGTFMFGLTFTQALSKDLFGTSQKETPLCQP